jgi:predicted peptidase
MSKQSPQTEARLVKEIKYLLYKPKNYKDNTPNPLLIFLHGAGERGDNLELVKKHGPPKLIDEGFELPFIVASPQLALNEWWSPSTVVWLLADIKNRLNVDPDRVYLTGLSMGGYGTWEAASKYPNLFAAIVPICGRGDPLLAERIKHIPTWIFHGAKDTVVPARYSEAMFEALEPYGNVRYTVYPEAEHDSWTATYEDKKLYEWLLSHKRSE